MVFGGEGAIGELEFFDTGEIEFVEDFLELDVVVVPKYESPIGMFPFFVFGEVCLEDGLDAGAVHGGRAIGVCILY